MSNNKTKIAVRVKRKHQLSTTPFSIIRKFMPTLATEIANFRTLAAELGQWRSIKERSAVNKAGEPIPWYTYPAIEYLAGFSFNSRDVFEFGCGNSSKYWARRARSVISIEDNHAWYLHTNQSREDNQTVLYCPEAKSYIYSLSKQGRLFDIIIIDGKWRLQCTEEAVKYLQEGGMIILDNSDRIEEKECCSFLRKQGFFQIDFSGFGPINGYCWTTSIFIQAPASLQEGFEGPQPIRGLGN